MIPENQDDVYTLSFILAEGDVVYASTTRKIQLEGRDSQKINLSLRLKVEVITIDLENSIIYLKGKTIDLNEHVKLGSYHTFNITLGNTFELHKIRWEPFMLKQLKERTQPQNEIIITIFYERDCVVSSVSQSRISILLKQEIKNKKFCNILRILEKHANGPNLFIIAGLTDIRNDFKQSMESSKELQKILKSVCVIKLPPECKKQPNAKVIEEILVNKEFESRFKNIQYIEDLKEVEKFLIAFAKESELICIGFSDLEDALDYGALDTLLIIDELYRPKTLEQRRHIEGFLQRATDMHVKVSIIPVSHYSGQKLQEMGGLGGILKFNYK